MERIIVTGGAGFIGFHTIKALLRNKKFIICIDNLGGNYSKAIYKEKLNLLSQNNNFRFYKADIRNKTKIKKIFKKESPNKVIHFAAKVGVRPSVADPRLYEEVNIGGTLNLLEIARKVNIDQFIFASSSSVYGDSKILPFSEKDNTNSQVSPYAATKKSAEILCRTYHNLYGITIICFRLFTVYGPYGRPDMAPYLFTDAIFKSRFIIKYGDGTTLRDYTYVDDIVRGIKAALTKKIGFEIINLGSAERTSINDFISIIENLLQKKARIKSLPNQKGDVKITWADISKAEKLLNYKPKTNLREGMQKFVESYLANLFVK